MCVSYDWESYGGGPCLNGRRERAGEDLRDGSQGLLFLSGQVLGLSSCAQCPPKESSRADKELPWAISAAQVLRRRTVTRLGAP